MNYIKLKAGDVRQEGDEWRKDISDMPYASYVGKLLPRKWTNWHRTLLLDHPILASDLMDTQYRRPCK